MTKEQLRSRIRDSLSGTLYLCGKPASISRFYKKYSHVLTIVGIVDTPCRGGGERWAGFYRYLIEEPEEVNAPELAHILLADFVSGTAGSMLVICQDGVYDHEIARMLDFFDLIHLRDYIYSSVADAVLDGRRVIVLQGYYCFMRDIYMFLQKIQLLCREYLLYACVYEEQSGIPFSLGLNTLIRLCDVYIYNQETRPYWFPKELLPEDCRMVSIPCVWFNALMPQIDRVKNAYRNTLALPVEGATLPYKYGDRELNGLLTCNVPVDKIVQMVSSEDYFPAEKVVDTFRRELRMLQLYDKKCDVKLSGYISEHYRTERLFSCNDHWEEPLAEACARGIAALLGCPAEDDVHLEFTKKYSQIPIYPSVAHALGIEWVTPETHYYLRWGCGAEYSTFQEYVRRYCETVKQMKSIKETW